MKRLEKYSCWTYDYPMRENLLNSKKIIFIPFFSSVAVFVVYFIEFQPAVYSWDSILIISAINDKEIFYRGVSYLYNLLLYMNFRISPDLITMTISQIALAVVSISKLFETVYRRNSKKLAYIILILTLLNPNIMISPFWIHRTSIFGWLFFLSIVLLYKLVKMKKLSVTETICLLLSISILPILRLDGIVFSLFALLSFFKISRDTVRYKRIFLYSSLLLLLTLKIIPYTSDILITKNSTLSLSHNVKKIKNLKNTEFSEKDRKILAGILQKKGDIKKWFNPESKVIDTDLFHYKHHSNPKWIRYFIWSAGFMAKNLPTLLKMQWETFKKSSLISTCKGYYFQFIRKRDNPESIKWHIRKLSRYMSGEKNAKIPFLRKAVYFLVSSSYAEERRIDKKPLKTKVSSVFRLIKKGASWDVLYKKLCYILLYPFSKLLNILVSGTAIPFFVSLVFIIWVFFKKKSVFYVLLPICSYNAVIFLMQPAPNAYYWYYLVISAYFIVLVIGYEIFYGRKASPQAPSS